MRRYGQKVGSALAVATLVATGSLAAAPAAQSSSLAAPPAAVETSALFTAVPTNLGSPGHEGIKARLWGFGFGLITVDVNPTLPGSQSYRVKLQVRRNGEWVTIAVKRTRNGTTYSWLVRGPSPHELVTFPVEVNQPSKYRIVLRPQHGFERTVSRVYYVS